MSKHIFIDESGDPGNILINGASSKHYAALALELSNDDTLSNLTAHIISWKYVLGKLNETKDLPTGNQCTRYLAPILELHNQGKLNCSCIYLRKESYSGPYLKPELPTGHIPLYFRNFIHKELLEYHFDQFPTINNERIRLIFDDYRMNFEEVRKFEDYLQNNWNLPGFWRIIHANSICAIPLQVASQLVTTIKDIALGVLKEEMKQLLSFIAVKDITSI